MTKETFECPDCLGDIPIDAKECSHCEWISEDLDGKGEPIPSPKDNY